MNEHHSPNRGAASQRVERSHSQRLAIIAAVLLLPAGFIFWRMFARWRQAVALNQGELYTRPMIVSRMRRAPAGPLAPFENLGLSSDQRQKIQQIINSSLSSAPPPSEGPGARPAPGPGQKTLPLTADGSPPAMGGLTMVGSRRKSGQRFLINFSLDKIRAILTPEQQQKLDAEQAGRRQFFRSSRTPGP